MSIKDEQTENVKQSLFQILNDSQSALYDASIGVQAIKNLIRMNDTQFVIIRALINCIDNILVVSKQSPFAVQAENVINFTSEMIAVFFLENDYKIISHYLLGYLVENHHVSSDIVRFRICQILNKTLSLVTTSDFDENLYERMQNCLIERMRDTNESVADEALHAASHLQDPTDHFCPVINAYIYLLKQFNALVDVRLKILDVLAINQKSLTLVKDLIYDKNARIRMSAYDLIRDKIKVKHLNDEYRWRLVKRIMEEDDKHLSDRLLKCLLSKWFNTDLDKDFLKLIKHLNIQKLKTDDEQAGILNLLGFLYQKFDMDTLEDQFIANFALKYDFNLYDVDVHLAFYYRSLVFHIFKKNDIRCGLTFLRYNMHAIFDNIKILISNYIANCNDNRSFQTTSNCQESQLFVVEQLFHVLSYQARYFDSGFVNEFERILTNIVCETRVFDESLFKLLLKQFEMTEKNPEILAEKYFSLINIMQDAECDSLDIESEDECFSIRHRLLVLCHILANDNIKVINPEIEARISDLILPACANKSPELRVYGTRSLGLCCLLSYDLTISYMFFFSKIMELDHTCVVIEAQKALFNIFFTFDFEDMNDSDTFNLSMESTDHPQRDRNYSRALAQSCLINLEKMLDSDNDELKFYACEGFAKLFCAGKTTSRQVLSKLLLTLFDPSMDKQSKIKSCLLIFFQTFSKTNKNNLIFNDLFVPFIEFLLDAPPLSNIARVDFKKLANYFCFLVYDSKDYASHDTILISTLNLMIRSQVHDNIYRFERLMNFLLDFKSNMLSSKRNSHQLIRISNLCEDIIKNGRVKKLPINTFFKDFYDDIKKNLEIIDRQAPAKRKSTAQDDDTHTKRKKT